jgi:hypothetical protein
MRRMSLALSLLLVSCLRASSPPTVPVGDDKTIVFPPFLDRAAGPVGVEGELYELDGVMLRAVMIAANDFLPPGAKNPSCPNRQEAQSYRVIRQGDVIFVYVYENEAYCGGSYLALDSGAKYAISTDGRILRRILDGHPEEGTRGIEATDAGSRKVPSRPGVTPAYDSVWNRPPSPTMLDAQDGGVGDGGSAVPGTLWDGGVDGSGGGP